MALFEKLIGTEGLMDPKLPIHPFMFWLRLWQQGERTRAEVITEFGLDASDELDLDVIKAAFQASADKVGFFREVKDMLYAGEDSHGFETKAEFVSRMNSLP